MVECKHLPIECTSKMPLKLIRKGKGWAEVKVALDNECSKCPRLTQALDK